MCGRFAQSSSPKKIAQRFQVHPSHSHVPEGRVPRYNLAPSQPVMAIRLEPEGERELVELTWGLLPSWSKEPKLGYSTINARAETVAEKPTYRSAFRKRRCLIPADGFFEWQTTPTGKQPWYITSQDSSPLAFAGLWEHWEGAGQAIKSCTIIVTAANSIMRPIHDRMPVILPEDQWQDWLAVETPPDELKALLNPYSSEHMRAWKVSKRVNSSKSEGKKLIEEETLLSP